MVGDAVFGGDASPRSELTCNGDNGGGYEFLEPRKRARIGAATGFVDGLQGGVLPQATAMQGLVLPGDAQTRAVGCGAASTSGRVVANNGASLSVLAQLYHQGVEIDELCGSRERMRAGLLEAHRRHARAVVSAVERAAAGRLRAAEAELEHARCRNFELEARLCQLTAEGQAWLGVAKSHEAVAVGLRATLDQLLQQPTPAEDAQSCCFETTPAAGITDDAASRATAAPCCKSCGGA
ncbi:hypothetical protein ACP70R_044922 [Stipagrostis hirtigluma subsp. patula]